MSKFVHNGALRRGIAAMGASAGGVDALMDLLPHLPAEFPVPIVVALHLPPAQVHGSRLPELLQRRTALTVKWAEQGEVPKPGTLYVAPQDLYTTLAEWGAFELPPAESRPVPSVDRLFASVARACGPQAVGVVLSGCLCDGALGSRDIVEAGGRVLIQDRATALQFDMPQASLEAGVAALVLPPRALAAALQAAFAVPGVLEWFRVHEGSPYLATAI